MVRIGVTVVIYRSKSGRTESKGGESRAQATHLGDGSPVFHDGALTPNPDPAVGSNHAHLGDGSPIFRDGALKASGPRIEAGREREPAVCTGLEGTGLECS